jgi:aspartate racemase
MFLAILTMKAHSVASILPVMSRTASVATAPLFGVLGGMGPLATADFYRRLVERTPASSDQDHLRVAIWADPTVPDRTAALLGTGPSPVSRLLDGLRWLELAGADYVAMPCNTAHAYLEDLRAATRVEILDMVSTTLEQARWMLPALRRLGVLSTRGTRAAAIYEKAARRLDVGVIQVTDEIQVTCVDPAIELVKAGRDVDLAANPLLTATASLYAAGAEAVVAACTEISVILEERPTATPVIDAASCLIDAVLARAGLRSSQPTSPQAGQTREHRSET